MLINFTLENWMSFRDKTRFTMVATREQQHGDRLTKLQKYRLRALPVAAIYGGNASGKSNFFRAIAFAEYFIIRGPLPGQRIAIEPFILDDEVRQQPVLFNFEILIENDIYELSFSLSATEVLEEKLIKITSTSEKTLYHRKKGNSDPRLHSSITNKQRHKFAFEGTQNNQLYLTNSVSQKLETFEPVYDWFAKTLLLISPDASFGSFEQFITTESPLYKKMNSALPDFDTGIDKLGGEEISLDSLQIPEDFKQKIKDNIREKAVINIDINNEKIVITQQENKLIVRKVYTYHRNVKGKNIKFEMRQESEGTQRIIDLLSAFFTLADSKKTRVYIIDELDRSLHYLLTRELLEMFLSHCNESSRRQLLFTTHDLLLMDQSLFRRDEMWITERKQDGNSELINISEFEDARADKDIRKSYLQGRMGGVPNIITRQIFPEES
ncbi:MAG: AAA family ATPase [Salinispira sp.]